MRCVRLRIFSSLILKFIHNKNILDTIKVTHIIYDMRTALITQKGFKKLKTELDELKNKKRLEIAEKLRIALAFGDIAENPEYAEAKEEQAFLEGRIAEIENILRTALLVNRTRGDSTFGAGIGNRVELTSAMHKKIYTLVGKGEGDPLRGEISSDSPLGQALLGRSVGDSIKVSTPSGQKKFKIISIA